ncbi:radical SAM protein, partial [Candidatus Woesearchaeota archaeon]|nr:radical SAM protein [Candidatus Woesearchaeota archaeon]
TGVFGLIDRNTNCIEVKPLTACNLDCVFCSVDAGLSSKKTSGYVVEKDYLVQEFNNLIKNKKHPIEAHIGPQGEPLLYAPLVELIRDLKKNPKVKIISIDTSGTLLTKKLINELAEAGLTRFNISLNALDEKKCKLLAGTNYNLKHMLEMIDYAGKKTSVLLAPVIVPTMNDEQLKDLVNTGKKLKSDFPVLGIQNFLNYKRGRNPVKQRNWEGFFKMLKPFEKKHNLRLKLCKEDFNIREDIKLEKPFKKKQLVKAKIVCDGPFRGEKIGVYKSRAIIVENATNRRVNSEIKIRIIRDKHNIFRGVKQ